MFRVGPGTGGDCEGITVGVGAGAGGAAEATVGASSKNQSSSLCRWRSAGLTGSGAGVEGGTDGAECGGDLGTASVPVSVSVSGPVSVSATTSSVSGMASWSHTWTQIQAASWRCMSRSRKARSSSWSRPNAATPRQRCRLSAPRLVMPLCVRCVSAGGWGGERVVHRVPNTHRRARAHPERSLEALELVNQEARHKRSAIRCRCAWESVAQDRSQVRGQAAALVVRVSADEAHQ